MNKVLVVDDSLTDRRVLTTYLEQMVMLQKLKTNL